MAAGGSLDIMAHGGGHTVFGKRLNESFMRNHESCILVECIDVWPSKHVGNITKCLDVTGKSSASQWACPVDAIFTPVKCDGLALGHNSPRSWCTARACRWLAGCLLVLFRWKRGVASGRKGRLFPRSTGHTHPFLCTTSLYGTQQ